MSRFLKAAPVLLIPLLPLTALAQGAVPPATITESGEVAVLPPAKLFPGVPVAQRIEPMVGSVKRTPPTGIAALAAKISRSVAAVVVPKPVPAVRPVASAPVATAAATPAPAAPAPAPQLVGAPQLAARPVAQQKIVAVTCKWGQDYSATLKACVNSNSVLAAPPRAAVAQAGAAKPVAQPMPMGVTVAPTPSAPGAIAGLTAKSQAGIAGAIDTARTKSARAKPVLDTTTRMSLGVAKPKP